MTNQPEQGSEHEGDRYGEQALDRGIPAASGSGQTVDPSDAVAGTAEGGALDGVLAGDADVPAEVTEAGTPAAGEVQQSQG